MHDLSFDNTANAFEYRSNAELRRGQVLFSTMSSSTLTGIGMKMTQWALKIGLPIKGIIKSTIYKQFCGGESLAEIGKTTQVLEKYGVDICLDYGVEGIESEEDFDDAVAAFVRTIDFAASKPNIPYIPLKVTGFAQTPLLQKISEGGQLSPEETKNWKRVEERIDTICAAAASKGLYVLIDAEESWLQQAVDDLTDLMMTRYNKDHALVFNTFQMYRHDRLAYIMRSHRIAQDNAYKLGVKLVRGAYMEKERARAKSLGYPSPIQPTKEATDHDYNAAIDFCFTNLADCSVFIGTHNELSCMKGAKMMDDLKLEHNDKRVSFSQLYGMSDNITFNLADADYNASKYLPYGPVGDVIPYLMRRAQENTSVKGQTGRELGLINKELNRRKSKA